MHVMVRPGLRGCQQCFNQPTCNANNDTLHAPQLLLGARYTNESQKFVSHC
jgi:hypothetical protein